jgi:signal transduction histidine kinase
MSRPEPLNILIVDDNKNNLLTLHGLIDEYIENVNVLEADAGVAALNTLMRREVDLIILDIQMPEMDGFETAEIIRSRKKTQRIPIVFLTAAYKSEEFKKRGYAIGAADYLTKPIDTPQLISKINTYLRFIQEEHQQSQYQQELERKVLERTAELVEINKRLTQEIGERQVIEEKLQWAKETAESANLAKSQFLATMSHELRTPLNAILGYSEMVKEEAIELNFEDVLPDLEKVIASGKHLLAMINDVLDISKLEAGEMQLYNETFKVSDLINEVVKTIQPFMESTGNIFEVQGHNDTLGEMEADLTKVRQILLNLLDNAAKFTHHGTVTLTVNLQEDSTNKWTHLQVTDTGIGLTEEQISKLFQMFTQVDSSSTRKYGGTGLGLVISKRFVEMMGGSLTVQSELGRGTTFSVQLPVRNIPDCAPEGEGAGSVVVAED